MNRALDVKNITQVISQKLTQRFPVSLGLAFQKTGSGEEEECIGVFQLTEAGDIFYQVLQPELVDEASTTGLPPQVLDHGSPQRHRGASSEDSDSSSELEMRSSARTRGERGQDTATSDGDVPAGHGTASGGTGGHDRTVGRLSDSSLHTWRHWILKLMKRRGQGEDRGPEAQQHVLVHTRSLSRLPAPEAWTDPSEQQRVERLWQDLSTCMSQHALLLNSTVSASLEPVEPVPLPEPVDADAWTDELSQRLTVSWEGGEDAWRSWWKKRLGLDREQNEEALRKRRRREKEARRAGGGRTAFSDSFSSSASCLSEWDDFSDSTGCFSTASQAAWSDAESFTSQRSWLPPRAATAAAADSTPSSLRTGSPAHSAALTAATQPSKEPRRRATSSPAPPSLPRTPQRTRDTLDSYLGSLIPPLVRGATPHSSPAHM